MGALSQRTDVIDFGRIQKRDAAKPCNRNPNILPEGTTLLFGQYTITDYLNCGGCGITYLAKDSLDRVVVIKECFPGDICQRFDKQMVAKSPKFQLELDAIVKHFIQEAHRLASMKHDNVVHVHQIFEENDTAYISMDFIDGPDLLDIIETDRERFSPEDIEALTRKVLAAIGYVHDKGVLHRDLSPDNIMIDKSGEPILIDFGAARDHHQAEREPARTRFSFVKDGYSPLEFYDAEAEHGTWSDLYTFAASLCHLITGTLLEAGEARVAAIAEDKPDPYVPLAGNVEGYSKRFLEAIDKALEVFPQHRTQTVEDWLENLKPKAPKKFVPQPVAPTDPKSKDANAPVVQQPEDTTTMVEIVQPIIPTIEQITPATAPAPKSKMPMMAAAAAALIAVIGGAAFFATNGGGDAVAVVAEAPMDGVPTPGDAVPQSEDLALVTDTTPGPVALDIEEAMLSATEAPAQESVAQSVPSLTLSLTAFGLPESGYEKLTPIDAAPSQSIAVAIPAPANADTVPVIAGAIEKPAIHMVYVSAQDFGLDSMTAAARALAAAAGVARPTDVAALPSVSDDPAFAAETYAPIPLVKTIPLAAVQVTYSNEVIRMPFEAEMAFTGGIHSAEIISVSDAADLAVSGDWIAEGVVIYMFNEAMLASDTPLKDRFAQASRVDDDGYARANVRFRRTKASDLERGVLAVPVVREIMLADGTELEARIVDGEWTVSVRSAAQADSGLQPGDVLLAEKASGTTFTSHEDLAAAFDALVTQGIATASLTVLRDGQEQSAEWRLASR